MARIGIEAYNKSIEKPGCHPMDFTGRAMKGYVFVMDEGIDLEEDFNYWIDLALDFNPMAISSKKTKR
jgi:hypothetical protein